MNTKAVGPSSITTKLELHDKVVVIMAGEHKFGAFLWSAAPRHNTRDGDRVDHTVEHEPRNSMSRMIFTLQ